MTNRVGILWRGDPNAGGEHPRLAPVFAALRAPGVEAEWVVFDEGVVDAVRARLRQLEGVLVWVDPVDGERDRVVLDALLREVADEGVWVSAHPDVIVKMGTKEVLGRTRDLPFGSDSHIYRDVSEFEDAFPARLTTGARVLKPLRGNAGIGVTKVQFVDAAATGLDDRVEIQDAHPRGTDVETMTLRVFMSSCARFFEGRGLLVDQPFLSRVSEGLVRCYLVQDEVVGFSTQQPGEGQVETGRVFGLPSAKTMYESGEARFAALRRAMEGSWVREILRATSVEDGELPLLWDADFLYGPRDAAGKDTYVLCEINISCVIPYPAAAPEMIARAVAARLATA